MRSISHPHCLLHLRQLIKASAQEVGQHRLEPQVARHTVGCDQPPVLGLPQHIRHLLERQILQSRLLFQVFDVLLQERLENHAGEWCQDQEHLLVLRLEIAMRIFDAEHDALGLILSQAVIHYPAFLQSFQNLSRRLV